MESEVNGRGAETTGGGPSRGGLPRHGKLVVIGATGKAGDGIAELCGYVQGFGKTATEHGAPCLTAEEDHAIDLLSAEQRTVVSGAHGQFVRHALDQLGAVDSGGKDPGVGFDVDDLRRHARYSGGYHPDQPYVQAFWAVVESFNKQQRADLLRFVTSCSRPPLRGFRQLNPPLCVHKVPIARDADRLPTSGTCMNLLNLPTYSSPAALRAKLLYAISAGAGFELS